MKSYILSKVNLLSRKPNLNYPQTWYLMPRNKTARKVLQRLCGWVGGHELSKTEAGYGGGDYADRWCRWCDKLMKVPKTSIMFEFPILRDLMKEVKS